MNSIGLVECKNVSKGILVTDEMLKSAGITLLSISSVTRIPYDTFMHSTNPIEFISGYLTFRLLQICL